MEVLVSKGFLVLAQNNNTTDYISQAYLLALSIKLSQNDVNGISLVTNDKVPESYKKVFDNIIPIPFKDDAIGKDWKVENRWKLYHASPYDETIVLDVDMLLLEDISGWWDYCSAYDVKFCSRIKNYKGDIIGEDPFHRKTFIANKLPNIYFGLHYFKKSTKAHDFYKVLEFVINNWELCWSKFAFEEYQNWLSMDLAASIAIELAGLEQEAYEADSPLEFIHMKVPVQDWPRASVSWQDNVPWVFSSTANLFVGNIKQVKLFHYVEDSFASYQLIKQLEHLNGS